MGIATLYGCNYKIGGKGIISSPFCSSVNVMKNFNITLVLYVDSVMVIVILHHLLSMMFLLMTCCQLYRSR